VQTCNLKVFEAAYRLVTPVGLEEVTCRVQHPERLPFNEADGVMHLGWEASGGELHNRQR